MFAIFSGPARQAILLAQDEAIGLGDDFVGTEHLLTGLAGVPDCVAGQLLAEHGPSVGLVRARPTEIRLAGQHDPAIAPADALAAIGVDIAAIRQRADEAFRAGRVRVPAARLRRSRPGRHRGVGGAG